MIGSGIGHRIASVGHSGLIPCSTEGSYRCDSRYMIVASCVSAWNP